MSKKTLLAAIKPLMSEIFIEKTQNIPGDDYLTFSVKEGQNVLMTSARLGLYRELFREYKAERDNVEHEKRKPKAKPLKAYRIGNGKEKAKFSDAFGKSCCAYIARPCGPLYVGGDYDGSGIELDAHTAAALIPLLKRFVKTGRIVKSDDGG